MADSTKEEGGKKNKKKHRESGVNQFPPKERKKKNPKIKTEKVREILQVKTHLIKKTSRNVNELSLKKLMTKI